MRKATVQIDGADFVIEELRSRANAKWRKGFEKELGEITALIQDAPGTDITDMEAMSALIQRIVATVGGSIEQVSALVVACAPAFPADVAYDSDVFDTFLAILGLAYPFGRVVEKLRSLMGGSPAPPTTQN